LPLCTDYEWYGGCVTTVMQTLKYEPVMRPSPHTSALRVKIVVADDDPDMQSLIAPGLRREGYEVIELTSGGALLDHLASALVEPERVWPPDLIVADVCMPGFTGLEVLAGLQRKMWSIPVVMISARTDKAVSYDAYRYGAKAFLQKPFRMDTLRELVHSLIWAPR
jgi:DNA-binding response OmpR family regulator